MSDPLSQIIGLLQPRAVFAKGISGSGAWGVRYREFGQPSFCAVIEGRCRLAVDGQRPLILEAGDFVLLPATPGFTISSLAPARPTFVDPKTTPAPVGEVRHGARGRRPDVRLSPSHSVHTPDAAAAGGWATSGMLSTTPADSGVCAVRAWRGDVAAVAGEIADFLKLYSLRSAVGDHYGAGVTVTSLQRVGVEYRPRPSGYDKSRIYLELVAPVLGGRVTFPKDEALLRELRSLDRRRGFNGRDKVDARGGAGKDDRANAAAGAVWLAGSEEGYVACAPVNFTRISPWDDRAPSYGDDPW